jgi:acyl dehydratase
MPDLTPGDALAPFVIQSVSPEAMRTLTALLRDPTPIHFAPEVVEQLGMGTRVINQGPANVGYVVNGLLTGLPDHELEHLQVRFLGNVLGEDRVVAGGQVRDVDDGRATIDVWLDVDGGERALEGVAVVRRRAG